MIRCDTFEPRNRPCYRANDISVRDGSWKIIEYWKIPSGRDYGTRLMWFCFESRGNNNRTKRFWLFCLVRCESEKWTRYLDRDVIKIMMNESLFSCRLYHTLFKLYYFITLIDFVLCYRNPLHTIFFISNLVFLHSNRKNGHNCFINNIKDHLRAARKK